ncbi:GNAT family N-acetyltransferase [Mucilaginibacter ximonensis]|uniref:GNAT family N-acetyltransferase n=1 Tax=Mucilaginibacter ximonensis TaxID=538021 RepID=A0ABW5YAF8_9SPHI
MCILPITRDNIDDCLPAFIKSYNSAPWNAQWTTETARLYLNEYLANPHFAGFILKDENDVIGAVCAHKKTWWTNKQLFIDEFFISPEKQRQGYGKLLMNQCAEYSRENGLELLVLMTNKYMPAYKFYNKTGYVNAEQFVFMFKQII